MAEAATLPRESTRPVEKEERKLRVISGRAGKKVKLQELYEDRIIKLLKHDEEFRQEKEKLASDIDGFVKKQHQFYQRKNKQTIKRP